MSLFHNLLIKFMPLVPKPIVKFVSKRYVAGATLASAIETVKVLNSEGTVATLDVLGESSTRREECEAAVNEYLQVLDSISEHKLDCNISLKPTQLGLLLDEELCYLNIQQILVRAAKYNNFVRIDMEDTSTTSATIKLFLRLHKEFSNVGLVIQACLRRSLDDINVLAEAGANLRLCKGIYNEPRALAFKDPAIVNQNFSLLIKKMLQAGCYIGIATHDEKIVWAGLKYIDQFNLDKTQYEFQMLLGVEEELRNILLAAGHKVRVYVPFGIKWYAYSMRRLKENPKIAVYIIKAFFRIKK